MNKTILTKKQIRNAICIYEWVKDTISRLTKEEIETSMKNNSYHLTKEGEYVEIINKDTYKFPIVNIFKDTDEHKTISKVFKLNEEVFNLDELKEELNDIENKLEFLQNLNITPIEKYVSKLVGFNVTFFRYYDIEKKSMIIKTKNIVEYAGCCKAMLKELYITTFGSIGFSIDRDTGEQFLWIPTINFDYTHPDGGHNGHEIGRVYYDINTKEWKGYNYETKSYEKI